MLVLGVACTITPISEELAKRGHVSIARDRLGSDWRPTQGMLHRDSNLPRYLQPGPQDPPGIHAIYLEWPSI